MNTVKQETTSAAAGTVDVLVLTDQERWHEYDRLAYLEDGRYHLSGIKEGVGIGSRDTHFTPCSSRRYTP